MRGSRSHSRQVEYAESELEHYSTTRFAHSFGHTVVDDRPQIDLQAVAVLTQRVSGGNRVTHAAQELDEVQRAMSEVEQDLTTSETPWARRPVSGLAGPAVAPPRSRYSWVW